MSDIRWGILATGWIAELQVKDLLQHGHTVTAVGSRSQAGADAFAQQFGIATAHPSYAALCADPNVDIVYVATPHPMHAENAILALNAGKHVMMEKPFTLNAREAAEVVALAKAKHLVVLEAMWTRFLPHMIRIREILASGVLGEIRSVIADHTQDLPDDPKHRLNDPALGGGALLDLGIYPLSFIHEVLGAPSSIKATARMKETGVDGSIAAVLGYDSGAIALTISASDAAGSNSAVIIGTEGRIEIDRVWYIPTSFTVYDSQNTVIETYQSEVEGRGMQYQAAEAERLILSGLIAGEILPPDETVAIMTTLDAIRAQIGLVYPGGR
ncbi:MAG: oxidoreductase [Devosia sp.]|nr:oxidoreductase [Devosia sp.]